MQLLTRLARNSAVYSTANLLQRALGFLLLPLYTRVLTPEENGILGVVGSVALLISVTVSLALHGAVTRFFFEYQDEPEALKEFWGTLVVFLMGSATFVGSVFFFVGEPLFGTFSGGIPFWPFMALGIVTAIFQPFFDVLLVVLQTRQKAAIFGGLAIASFVLRGTLCVGLVAGFDLGATGALAGLAGASVVCAFLGLFALRNQVTLCFRTAHLRTALGYSLPLFPHTFVGQGRNIADRLLVNALLGTAAAGLYHVAFQFGNLVQVVAISTNRAFTPLFMAAMKDENEADLESLRRAGRVIVFGQCLVAAGIGIFGREILLVLTGPAFHGIFPYLPFLAFAFALNSVYFLHSSVLFYDRQRVGRVSGITLATAAVGLTLQVLWIPRWGLAGAAAATLAGQLFFTAITAVLARRHSAIAWEDGRYAIMIVTSFAASLTLGRLGPAAIDEWSGAFMGLKILGAVGLVGVLSVVAGGHPLALLRAGRQELETGAT